MRPLPKPLRVPFALPLGAAFLSCFVPPGAHAQAPSAAGASTSAPAPSASASTAMPVRTFEVGDGVKVSTFVLPNGLTVILARNPRAPLVSVYHWVKAGSLHEKPGVTGIAHLFEHMMFRPLGEGKPGFFDVSQKLGAQVNANTRFESTVYTSTVPRRNLEPLLEAEAARFATLKVTDALLDVERKAVWSEYSTKFDAAPSFDLWYEWYRKGFAGHPFEWMIIGFREDLPKITARDCNSFFGAHYRPNNVGLVIAGDIDPDSTLAAVERLYGKWERGPESTLPPPFTLKAGPVRSVGKLPAGAKQVLAGWRLPYMSRENAQLFSFVNHMMFDSGNDLASRRFVDRERVATSIGGFSFDYGHGMLAGYVTVPPGVTDEALVKQFEALPGDIAALDDTRLAAYAKEFQVALAEGLERNESIVDSLATAWGKYGDETLVNAWSRTPPAVTKQALAGVVAQIMSKDNFVYVTTPPPATAGKGGAPKGKEAPK